MHGLAERALDWILCVGVVPVTFERDANTSRFVPVVPVPESVTISVRTTRTGGLMYDAQFSRAISVLSCLQPTEGAAVPRVLVWDRTDNTPTAKGRLTTAISRLEYTETFLNCLRMEVLKAEHLRSNPPYVTQSRKGGNPDESNAAWNVPDEVVRAASMNRRSNLESVAQHQHHMHAESLKAVHEWGGGGASVLPGHVNFDQECRPREHPIEEERDMVRHQIAESAVAHLPTFMGIAEDNVYRVLGVPAAMVMGKHQVRSSYMQEHSMNITTNRLKQQLERFLNECVGVCDLLGMDDILGEDMETNGEPLDGGTTLGHGYVPDVDSKGGADVTDTNIDKPSQSCMPTDDQVPARETKAARHSPRPIAEDRPLQSVQTFDDIDGHGATSRKSPSVTIPGLPCMRPQEMTVLMDRGFLSFVEVARLVRGTYGAPEISDTVLEQQRIDANASALLLHEAGVKRIQPPSALQARNNEMQHREHIGST
jgi:hypothetical protein